MKISAAVLRDYTELPESPRELRDLLDDLGLEVKRQEDWEGTLRLTLELLANRGDHHCYAGLAREITGRTGGELRLPELAELAPGASPVRVEIETPLCLVYTATLLEKHADDPLAYHELRPLLAAGLESVSPPVDATNLANLELGQPTHAFDADRIDGAIVIRPSRPGERAWPLFTAEPREIPAGTLVIADRSKILAIAGVIGCEESKTTEATTRILLESATFDPVAVRKASRALAIHTDSSARFERGGDPSAPIVGAARVVHLLERHGWKRVGNTGVFGAWRDPDRILPVEIGPIAVFLEHPLTEEEIRGRLERYGFAVSPPWPDFTGDPAWPVPQELQERGRERMRNTLLVRVPPHRLWDVEYPADLVEELAKSIGYNATPSHLPPVDMGALPSPAEEARDVVEQVLVGHGYFEVFTDGFYGRDVREKLGIAESHPLWAHVETLNSLDRGYSLLKNNALAQAVDTVARNLNVQNRRILAFERTRTFHPDADAENEVCTERPLLWAVACGPARTPSWAEKPRPTDLFHLKGLVQELATALRIDLTVGPADPSYPIAGALHPNRQATVRQNGKVVGVLGEVHPRVCAAYKIKRERPVYLEIEESALVAERTRPAYVAPPDQPPVQRDLAFTLPARVTAGEIAQHLRHAGPSWLLDVAITDLFEHEEAGEPVRTVTFALRFSREGGALLAEEINQTAESLVQAVRARFGDRGVKLRA
jgi:phenylalanyl-tRNA synthetase beta chain